MFNIDYHEDANILSISGQFDHSKLKESKEIFSKVSNSITVDMTGLEYICSGGIGILVMTYTRLKEEGKEFYLTNLNEHIRNVFKISLLDKVFIIK